MKNLLITFSYIFHPLFISIYAVFTFFFFGDFSFMIPQFYSLLLQIIIITILLPLTFYFLFLSLGKVNSMMLSETSQRKIPLFIHAILIFVLIKRSITIYNFPELHYFFLGSLISTILALILVFFKVKASLHMVGISSLVVFTISLQLHFGIQLIFPIIVLILCAGLVASSRLEMKAHTLKELSIGTFIGLLSQIIVFWL